MGLGLTRRLTGGRPIRPTTPRCPTAWRRNARAALGQLADPALRLTRQEFPLNDAGILFKEPEPPQLIHTRTPMRARWRGDSAASPQLWPITGAPAAHGGNPTRSVERGRRPRPRFFNRCGLGHKKST